MKISSLNEFGYELLQPDFLDKEISAGYTSDLMSDVMANAEADSVLITIQAHKNTVAVASLVEAGAIIICNNRPVPPEMIEAAAQEKIALFRTTKDQFKTSCEVGAKL